MKRFIALLLACCLLLAAIPASAAEQDKAMVFDFATTQMEVRDDDGELLLTYEVQCPRFVSSAPVEGLDLVNGQISAAAAAMILVYESRRDDLVEERKRLGERFQPHTAKMTGTPVYFDWTLLSVVFEGKEDAKDGKDPLLLRYSEVYQVDTGRQLDIADLVHWRPEFVDRNIYGAFAYQVERHPYLFYDDAGERLQEQDIPYFFYFYDNGLVFYSIPGALSPSTKLPEFELRYEDDPFLFQYKPHNQMLQSFEVLLME